MKPIIVNSITIDCIDPKTLSDFYIRMLGWEKTFEEDDFVCISTPYCDVRIGFQRNMEYVPPIWPEKQGEQQQMVHIDFKSKDKDEMMFMVQHALNCGAKKAEDQFSDLWTVMIDPAGHPFCFDTL